MPFETFMRQRRADQQPYVTLQKKGSISLNRAAFEALNNPDAVELLYDREANSMGLRHVDSSLEHSYKVRTPAGSHGTWLIAGGAFARYYEIDISASVRRAAHMEGDLLIVDLNDPGVDSRSKARG